MTTHPSEEGRDRLLAGRYLLGEPLGRGGMGVVWRARDQLLDREVAVKELQVSGMPDEDLHTLFSRMQQEARAAARIDHPSVIIVHDVVEQDGRPWIVMELVDGQSLAEILALEGTLLPRDAARVGAQVASALAQAHRQGVLHRDVKPANVMIDRRGRVVLTDFGIARFEGRGGGLTRTGEIVGSPDYLAPERVTGHRPGPEADLWALGATLYAAVEGQSPFLRSTTAATLQAVMAEPLPEPVHAGPLAPVIAALMSKDPAERVTGDDAVRMLEEVARGRTPSTPTLISPPFVTPDRAPAPPEPAAPTLPLRPPGADQPTEVVPPTPQAPGSPGWPGHGSDGSYGSGGGSGGGYPPPRSPSDYSTLATPPPGRSGPPTRDGPRRRRRWWAVIAAAVLAAALVGGGAVAAMLATHSHHSSATAQSVTGSASPSLSVTGSASPSLSRSPTAASPGTPVTTPPAPPAPNPTPGPAQVVTSYYAAINGHDYATAWNLGGKNLSNSFSSFSEGFADTASDTVTVDSVSGDTAFVHLHAVHNDGSAADYSGSYTVDNGVITGASIQRIG
jgi:serine/threonine protein kinase